MKLIKKIFSPKRERDPEWSKDIHRPHVSNPMHRNDDGWFFWDETWTQKIGPYPSKRKCRVALEEYSKTL